jgi:hypothetical protein
VYKLKCIRDVAGAVNPESEQPRLGSKSVKRKRWKHRGSLMHKRRRLERQQTLSAFRKASKLSRKKASSAKSVSSAVRGRLRHRQTLSSFRKALLRKAACGTKSTSPEKQQRARALEDDYTEVGLNLDSMPWFGELQSKTLYKGKLFSSTGQALLTPSVSSPGREGLQEFFVQQKSMGRVQEYPCKQLTSSKDGLGSPSREPSTSSQQKKAIVKTEVSGSSSKTSSVRQESMGRVHPLKQFATMSPSREPPTSSQQKKAIVKTEGSANSFSAREQSMRRVYPCKRLFTSSNDGLGYTLSPSREPPTSSQQKKAIVKTEVSGSSSKTSSVRQESMGRVHPLKQFATMSPSREPPTSSQQKKAIVKTEGSANSFSAREQSMRRVYPCKRLFTSSNDGLGYTLSPSREPPTSSQQKKAIVKTEVSGSSSKTSSVRQESMGRVHLFASSKDGLSPTKNLSRKPPTSFQQNSSSVASLSSDYSSSTPYPYSASAAGASEDESGDTTAGLVGSDEEGDGEKSLWGGDGQDSGSSLSDTVAVIYWHVICIQDKVRTLLKEAYRK